MPTPEAPEMPNADLMERGIKTLELVFREATTSELKPVATSTNEATFLIQAARLAVESGLTSSGPENKMHAARLRGVRRLAELRKAAEPCWEPGDVSGLLGVSPETVRKKTDRKHIFALPRGSDRVYPAFQFKEGDVIPGVQEVLQALETASPFVTLAFFLSKSPGFGDKTAIEALQAGMKDEVVSEAKGLLKHGT